VLDPGHDVREGAAKATVGADSEYLDAHQTRPWGDACTACGDVGYVRAVIASRMRARLSGSRADHGIAPVWALRPIGEARLSHYPTPEGGVGCLHSRVEDGDCVALAQMTGAVCCVRADQRDALGQDRKKLLVRRDAEHGT